MFSFVCLSVCLSVSKPKRAFGGMSFSVDHSVSVFEYFGRCLYFPVKQQNLFGTIALQTLDMHRHGWCDPVAIGFMLLVLYFIMQGSEQ